MSPQALLTKGRTGHFRERADGQGRWSLPRAIAAPSRLGRSRFLFLIICLILALGPLVLAGESAPILAILHTNDVHGRFAASDKSIGHDRIAAVLAETRQWIPATLLLDAGDAVQGSGLVSWNQGEAAIEIMNAAGYDALTLGNHEFDYGWDNLALLADKAEFPFLTQPAVSENAPGFEAAVLFERGGRRIGVFGLTTPETKQSSAGGFGKHFGETDELLAYAAAMTASLRSAGAEAVVCLTHLGVEDAGFLTSYDLRDRVSGIDVIIDGHSHTPLAEIIQAAGKSLIVSTGEYAEALGVVEFHCADGKLIPLARSITKEETAGLAPNPSVAAIIAKWSAEAEGRNGRVLARSAAALDASRWLVRTQEAELGNLLADAIRAATDCEAAFINGGGIRSSLPAGEVTAADIEDVLPYDATVLTAKLLGGIIKEALEHGVSRYPEEFGGFLQVSGLTFSFDPKHPAGKRITGVTIGGLPLDADRLYKISVVDWLAFGGDGYEMLVEPFKKLPASEMPKLIDVFARHLNQHKDGPPPVIEGRISPQVRK